MGYVCVCVSSSSDPPSAISKDVELAQKNQAVYDEEQEQFLAVLICP